MPARQRAHARAPVCERAANLIGRAGRAFEDDGLRRRRPYGLGGQNEHFTAADPMPAGCFNSRDSPGYVRAVQIVGEIALIGAFDMQAIGGEALAKRGRLAVQSCRRN